MAEPYRLLAGLTHQSAFVVVNRFNVVWQFFDTLAEAKTFADRENLAYKIWLLNHDKPYHIQTDRVFHVVPIDLNAFMFDEYAVPTTLYHIGDEIATDLPQALFIFNQRPDMPLVTFQPDNPLD